MNDSFGSRATLRAGGRDFRLARLDALEKRGFSVPLASWFAGELRDLPREILLDPATLGRGYFREPVVRGLIDDHVAGRRDSANKIWALIQLELWLRTFIDTKSRQPLAITS